LALLPLTALIRYQYLLEIVLPLQVALQALPVTLVATVTFVPALRVALILALVDALVRRLTVQAASLTTLADAVPGRAIAVIANTNTADSNALMRRAGRGERWPGRTD
jgi:hypothetical protein